jgi:hypothetical protein
MNPELMTLACPTCPTIRTRKIHPGGRLEGIGAFTQSWIFHTCDVDAGRMCPDCLAREKAKCERCSDRAGLVGQLGNPTYRRRRYSRDTTTPSPDVRRPAGHDRKA